VGDKALGAVSALTYCSTLDTPANVAFTKAYRAKYPGLTPSFYTEGGYTSVMWIQRAVDALHGDLQDKNKLLAALRKVEITDAPRGPVKLDEYGNPVENVYIQKVVMIDGKPHNKLITTFKSVSQFWKWNPLEYMSTPVYSRNYPPCKFCDTGK
jgi:branched-chain amino acid transport system substrate-binding protein